MPQSFKQLRLRKAPLLPAMLLVALLSAPALVGCKGKVKHPDPGEGNTEKYCADRKPKENNCMACSSQPGCGWCETPASGKAHCQPGVDSSGPTKPGLCVGDWALSTEDCDTPPPPPPGVLASETEADVAEQAAASEGAGEEAP